MSDGQLFIANEAGAELVGRFGNQTGVVNNDQIIKSISDAVYKAMMSAQSTSDAGGQVNEYRFFLDGRELTARVEEVQRNKGASLLSGVVYG